MSVRESFVAHFGEAEATRVEEASLMHLELTPLVGEILEPFGLDQDRREMNWGTDPFKWHLRNAITHDCLTKWRDSHHIHASVEELQAWCKLHGDLDNFDGDDPDPVIWALTAEGWH